MSLRAEVAEPVVEAAPGEVVDVVIAVVNDGDAPATLLATPIGLGDAARLGLADQRFEIPAHSRLLVNVRAAVPATHGIGQHAEAIELRQPGARDGKLIRYTLSIASVQRVILTPTPTPVRGRRGARFDVAIVNNERHTVEVDLAAEGGTTRVVYAASHFRLGAGERAITAGKVSHRPRWFGEPVVHHVQLVARGRAASTAAHLPFVQRPVIAGRLRSAVAALVVVGLWASIAGAGLWWYRNRDDTAPADADRLAPIATDVDPSDVPGSNTGGSTGDVPTDPADAGVTGDTGGVDEGGSDAGGAGSGEGGSGDDAVSGDAGSGGGVAAVPPGSGSTGADDSPVGGADSPDGAPDVAAATTVVRGTVDADGGATDVTITPSPMSLQDIADSPRAAFSLAERSPARKIWSARYVPPGDPIATVSTTAIASGPFAPDVDGIWGVSLPLNQTFELAFRKPGFEQQSFVVTPKAGEQIDLDVSLQPASGSLAGTATAGGRPLENVRIVVTDGHVDYQTVTDEDGVWGIEGVSSSPGYVVVGNLEGFGTDATIVPLAPGDAVDGIRLDLQSGRAVLTGRVVDAVTGRPLGGATVTAVNGADTSTTTTLTEGDVGSFQLPQLAVGARYAVTADLTGYRTATTSALVGAGLTSIPPLRLQPLAATIGGTVVDAATGAPIAAASVTLTRDDLPQPVASVQTVNGSGGDAGAFTLGRVPPGQYLLTVDHWQHATIRHTLVVDSASEVRLDPDDPERAQTGPSFALVMEPIDTGVIGERPTGALSLRIRDADETRECPPTTDGGVRPPEQCSAIFGVRVEVITTDPYFVERADRGEGPFRRIDRDPDTKEVLDAPRYVLRCEPDGPCSSGEDFPDYTIRGIPIGAYTVRLSHKDYNPRTVPVTIRPDTTTAETVNMARLGAVIGQVLDASQLPLEVSILDRVGEIAIRSLDGFGVLYPTRVIDGTFQTDERRLLPPGLYEVLIDATDAGFWVDPDQDIDGEPATGGLQFRIPIPDPDNPTGRTVLAPILAEPYPAIETRVLAPTAITPDIAFAPITVEPTVKLTCIEAPGLEVDGIVSGNIATFDPIPVATLDVVRDGELDTCTLAVEAPGFLEGKHTFGAIDPSGAAVAPLAPLVDRWVDIAVVAEAQPGTIRQPRGTLVWTDTGPDPDQQVPVPGATITPSGVVTALIPADTTAPPGAGVYAVRPYEMPIDPIESQLDDGTPPKAVWSFPGVTQMIGTARYDIDAAGYPGGTLIVTIDHLGAMTTDVEMTGDLTATPGGSAFAVDLEPSAGTLRGRVTVWTSDPTIDYASVIVESELPGAIDPTLTLDAAGNYSESVAAGTWVTTVTATESSNLEVVAPATENLTACLPPDVAPVGGPTADADTATFRQCVGPGAPSTLADTTLVELGRVRLRMFDLAVPPRRIDDLEEFTVALDGLPTTSSVDADDGGPGLLVTGIDVPRDVDPPDHPAPPTAPLSPPPAGTPHVLRLTDAGNYDPTDVDIVVFRTYRGTTERVEVDRFSAFDLATTGVALLFEPGAKYELDVTLPSYGSVTGTIPTRDSRGGTPPICTDPGNSTIAAEVTAIPVTRVDGDDITTFDHWVADTRPNRVALTTDTCGNFELTGKSGDYAIAVDHPEFGSDRTPAELLAILASPGGLPDDADDAVVTIPFSGTPDDPPAPIVDPLPGLAIRGTFVDLLAVEVVGGAAATGVVHVVRDSDGDLVAGPAAVTDEGMPELTLDPDETYTIELRGCATPPADVAGFDACALRFPVSLALSIARATDPPPTIQVVAPVVQVGAEITTTMLFENERDRPVCPTGGTYTVERRYDTEIIGRVDGEPRPLDVDDALREEIASFAVPVETSGSQTACATASGAYTETFDEWLPTGTHTLTFPRIAGYGPPTLTWDPDVDTGAGPTAISGVAVGTTHVEFEITVTSIDATTAAVARYEAVARSVSLRICGETSNGNPDCDEEFPDLSVSLTEPGSGDAVAGTVGVLDDATGYPVVFSSIVPDAQPHQLGIVDELHAGAPNELVLVLPGNGPLQLSQPFTFAGSSVRLAFRTQGLSSSGGTPAPLAAGVTVFGSNNNGNNGGDELAAGTACTILVDGSAQSYTCFVDNQYTDYRVVVEAAGYITEEHLFLDRKKGETLTATITLIRAAILTVDVDQYDAAMSEVTPFNTALASLVVLQPVQGGGAIEALAGSTGCAASTGCFRFQVQPGNYVDPDSGPVGTRSYRFVTGPTSSYVADQSATITAQVGATPQPADLELRPRVVTVTVTAPGVTISGVDLTFGSSTVTRATGPFRFTSLDASPIPVTGTGTILVRASNGRNVTLQTSAGVSSYPVTVLPYLTVTGTAASWTPVGTTVTATSGGTTRSTTVQPDRTFTFAGTGTGGGLDVNADGTARSWTVRLDDDASTTATVVVESDTASPYEIEAPLSIPTTTVAQGG